MTAKQTSILKAATTLFAKDGVDGVSTARIAREAGVSEGLIFRHFRNKQGLVDAIVTSGQDAQSADLDKIAAEADPGQRILLFIDRAFAKRSKEADYQQLRNHLGSLGKVDDAGGEKQRKLLTAAFKALNYEDPTMEGAFLHHSLQGITEAVRQGQLKQAKKLKGFVQAMYS